jgi:mRNA interferase HigB
VRLLGRTLLASFAAEHADSRDALRAWEQEVVAATWTDPHQLRQRYPTASLLGDGVVVFNIRGNRYRLVARVEYARQVVLVQRIGTHAEYDRWDLR